MIPAGGAVTRTLGCFRPSGRTTNRFTFGGKGRGPTHRGGASEKGLARTKPSRVLPRATPWASVRPLANDARLRSQHVEMSHLANGACQADLLGRLHREKGLNLYPSSAETAPMADAKASWRSRRPASSIHGCWIIHVRPSRTTASSKEEIRAPWRSQAAAMLR
jgi:hypothetical protein